MKPHSHIGDRLEPALGFRVYGQKSELVQREFSLKNKTANESQAVGLTGSLWQGKRLPCQCPRRLPSCFGGEKRAQRLPCPQMSPMGLPAEPHWLVHWGVAFMSRFGRPIGRRFALPSTPPGTPRSELFGFVLLWLFYKQTSRVYDALCISCLSS